ncbi:hypothetical protein [Methylobacterium sp. R2-1]|uniref:hypothetical protein n=1 Tax=Methylobacterium sp. R2-1 TaxID=2587064 RepID=UPI001608862F|nr:hypothetical protein [Methylobacterium sp. R2-1]MBB2962565.1 ActR/RegA family two-component response regulator [Methylobacterium sp. R2-1]
MTEPDRRDVVLLVQTNSIAGLDLADALAGAGYRVSEPAWTTAEAQRWLVRPNPARAVLDLATADDAGPRLARTLRRRGVPFVICAASGAAGPFRGFAVAPRLPKPAWSRDVIHAMDELAAQAGRAP